MEGAVGADGQELHLLCKSCSGKHQAPSEYRDYLDHSLRDGSVGFFVCYYCQGKGFFPLYTIENQWSINASDQRELDIPEKGTSVYLHQLTELYSNTADCSIRKIRSEDVVTMLLESKDSFLIGLSSKDCGLLSVEDTERILDNIRRKKNTKFNTSIAVYHTRTCSVERMNPVFFFELFEGNYSDDDQYVGVVVDYFLSESYAGSGSIRFVDDVAYGESAVDIPMLQNMAFWKVEKDEAFAAWIQVLEGKVEAFVTEEENADLLVTAGVKKVSLEVGSCYMSVSGQTVHMRASERSVVLVGRYRNLHSFEDRFAKAEILEMDTESLVKWLHRHSFLEAVTEPQNSQLINQRLKWLSQFLIPSLRLALSAVEEMDPEDVLFICELAEKTLTIVAQHQGMAEKMNDPVVEKELEASYEISKSFIDCFKNAFPDGFEKTDKPSLDATNFNKRKLDDKPMVDVVASQEAAVEGSRKRRANKKIYSEFIDSNRKALQKVKRIWKKTTDADSDFDELAGSYFKSNKEYNNWKSKQLVEEVNCKCLDRLSAEERADQNLRICDTKDCETRFSQNVCPPNCGMVDQAGTQVRRCRNNVCYDSSDGYRLKIIDAGAKGKGVVADEYIPKDGIIIEYLGEIISRDEFKRRNKLRGNAEMMFFAELNAKQMIDSTSIGNRARLINHCCPGFDNCRMERVGVRKMRVMRSGEEEYSEEHIVLVATEDIQPGTELAYVYSKLGTEEFLLDRCLCRKHDI